MHSKNPVALAKTNSGKKNPTGQSWRLVGGCSWSLTSLSATVPYQSACCTSSYITFHSCFYRLFWIEYFCLWNARRCCHSLLGWAFLLLLFFFFNLYESLVQTWAFWFWLSRRFVLIFLRDLLMEMCLSCPNLINNSLAVLVIVLDSPRP